MKKTLTAAAFLLTTMAHSQVTQVLTDLGKTYSGDASASGWYVTDGSAIAMRSSTPVGVMQTVNEWVDIMVKIEQDYRHLAQTKKEVLLPSYCDGIKDYSCVSAALRTESATVLVRDVFVAGEDTMTLVLKMGKQHSSVVLIGK
jgi:hypothetical protein